MGMASYLNISSYKAIYKMISFSTKLFSAISILSPILFVIVRLLGWYNKPGQNTWIFFGFFILSLTTIFLTYDSKEN